MKGINFISYFYLSFSFSYLILQLLRCNPDNKEKNQEEGDRHMMCNKKPLHLNQIVKDFIGGCLSSSFIYSTFTISGRKGVREGKSHVIPVLFLLYIGWVFLEIQSHEERDRQEKGKGIGMEAASFSSICCHHYISIPNPFLSPYLLLHS